MRTDVNRGARYQLNVIRDDVIEANLVLVILYCVANKSAGVVGDVTKTGKWRSMGVAYFGSLSELAVCYVILLIYMPASQRL